MGQYSKGLLIAGSIVAMVVVFLQFPWIGKGPGTAIFLLAVAVVCLGVGMLLKQD